MDEKEHRLHRLFYPRSIAVVGAKREGDYSWLRRALNFPGPKYNVNIDRAEWPGAAEFGVPSYASVADIPDHVDYVSITVPAPVVPRILEDCIKKGVIGAQMFTSGFSETGTEEGLRLEETITRMARESGLLLVGPNCLGLYKTQIRDSVRTVRTGSRDTSALSARAASRRSLSWKKPNSTASQ